MKFVFLLLLSGCATPYWVERSYDPKGGTVGYRNEGWGIDASKKKAGEMMAGHCSPTKYQITSDKLALTSGESEHLHVNFSCQ